MNLSLFQWNAVVTANHFNPSILSQLWLVKTGVVREEEFVEGPGTIFSDGVVQVTTTRFALLVLPDQIQIAPVSAPKESAALVQERLGTVVRTLPHTPYTAVGINFVWHADPGEVPLRTITRKLFSGTSDVYGYFSDGNSHFGAYLSKDVGLSRLKLDIKPISAQMPDGQIVERLQLGFNFHTDVEGDGPVEAIAKTLGEWDRNFLLSEQIAEAIAQNAKRT
ncbi:MAG TPA: hypothetical protein VH560_06840 [Polyangia bacterium]|jgi:hypothetical protein|nr:hypothetical protein [Polyangia bacterium]